MLGFSVNEGYKIFVLISELCPLSERCGHYFILCLVINIEKLIDEDIIIVLLIIFVTQ